MHGRATDDSTNILGPFFTESQWDNRSQRWADRIRNYIRSWQEDIAWLSALPKFWLWVCSEMLFRFKTRERERVKRDLDLKSRPNFLFLTQVKFNGGISDMIESIYLRDLGPSHWYINLLLIGRRSAFWEIRCRPLVEMFNSKIERLRHCVGRPKMWQNLGIFYTDAPLSVHVLGASLPRRRPMRAVVRLSEGHNVRPCNNSRH